MTEADPDGLCQQKALSALPLTSLGLLKSSTFKFVERLLHGLPDATHGTTDIVIHEFDLRKRMTKLVGGFQHPLHKSTFIFIFTLFHP